MDALRQEMERKRKATAELTGGKKWVKKGDIEKARVAQYMEAQALEEEERKKRQAAVAASDAADVGFVVDGAAGGAGLTRKLCSTVRCPRSTSTGIPGWSQALAPSRFSPRLP